MLFQKKEFLSHSGKKLKFKVDCDYLTQEEIDLFAEHIASLFKFGNVEGVPTGGLRLAKSLEKHIIPNHETLLIVDDVLTTGKSMEEQRNGRKAVGVVLFCRTAEFPEWICPLWILNIGE